jgi:phosphoribosylformimino-5-aminoimidazole carboxamide ribotide isomerase
VIVIPAIDVLGGKAVRLHQGRYDRVTVYDDRPAERARGWCGQVPILHVVDLEGARAGRPVQRAIVREIVAAFDGHVQIGGGVRERETFEDYLGLGAARVVLGSAAVRNAPLVRALAAEHPGVVVLAVDARDGFVAVEGWTESTRVGAADLVRSFADSPLAGILYTDVGRDGTRVGPNIEATAALSDCTRAPIIASGGIGSLDDLRTLEARGISACIVGRALYEGTFSLAEAVAAARPTSERATAG